ncbi:MAG: ABC transporter substrate-binding protein [Gammaproteobacteria bacterium]|nr:ABC transporter substrate-binding protein [Gammaproteobacteria bacterium]
MRTILLVICLGLAPVAVTAQSHAPGTAATPGAYAPLPATPDQIIRQGIDRLTGFLIGVGNPDPPALVTFLEQEIAPYFDFDYMAQWAAGSLYRRLTPEQNGRLAYKLKHLFLDALARNLGTYARPLPRIDVFPARAGRTGNEATVDTRVVTDTGLLVQLEFRFYWSNDGWKIYDVSANGASAVAFYRGYFSTLIRRYGPDVALR